VIDMHDKFEVSIALTISVIWRGSLNFNSMSRRPFSTPVTYFFILVFSASVDLYARQI